MTYCVFKPIAEPIRLCEPSPIYRSGRYTSTAVSALPNGKRRRSVYALHKIEAHGKKNP